MRKNITKILSLCVGITLCSCSNDKQNSGKLNNEDQKSFKIAWSPYTGWEPIAYMVDSGILKKHADKHGIVIEVDKLNDYVESINLYTSGEYDCVSVTNIDALTMPAVGGVDSTFLLPTDFSNGNDALVSKGANSVSELKGATVNLVEFSVSHYLLARALQENGLSERDLTCSNSSDAQLGSLFTASDKSNVVTWNPIVNSIKSQPGAKILFDSSQIPGEIIDTLLVKTNSNDAFKKALTGAWYETMAVMQKKDPEAMKIIAASAGGSLEDFNAQLTTTQMFYSKEDAAKLFQSDDVKNTMEFVRTFAYDKGLFGKDAPNKDFIGIEFADGSIIGDKNNVKLRFTAEYLK